MKRRLLSFVPLAALAAVTAVGAAKPAHAWKPKTHIYIAEQALKDAVDDGKVTIYETDYRNGKILGVLGQFPVDPRILEALKANPKQYRAGVLGPDAYPDITTGQCLIHPHQAHALDGQIADGTNSWLQHLWNLSYTWGWYPQTEIRAFTAGYLTHAAGDLFAHTFMNNFSGGEFMLQPDPRNALKHLVLEGYIGKRTPLTIDTFGTAANLTPELAAAQYPGSSLSGLLLSKLKDKTYSNPLKGALELEKAIVTENDISIDGVETFIAAEMTTGKPGSVLYDRLLNVDERKKSLPYLFSTLRNHLQGEVDAYNKLSTAKKALYSATHPGRITFIEHWIKDIDKGLKQWPKTSHELAKALVYNESNGGANVTRVREILSDYMKNYLAYMGPVPDIAVDALKFMGSIMDALVPDVIKNAIDDMVKDFQNWVVKQATGKNLDEWVEYVSNPETHFDEIMNRPGGERPGRNAQNVTLAQMNQQYLKITDTGFSPGTMETFKINDLPPAFNTLQMCKMVFLGKEGMSQLLNTLAAKGVKRPALPTSFENVMLGWHQSLDNDNQWQGLASKDSNPNAKLIFAQDGGAMYQHLFLRQVGEVDWVTEQPTKPTPKPPPPGQPTGPTTPPTTGETTNPTTPPPPVGEPTNPTTPGNPTPPATPTPPANPGTGTGNNGNGGIVPGKPGMGSVGDGKFYSLDQFDIRVDKVQRGRGDIVELIATVKYKGPTKGGITASVVDLKLTDTDGIGIRTDGNLYRASGEDPVLLDGTVWLNSGEEARVRYLFHVPESVTVLKKLTAQEHGTRVRTFDLSSVTLEEPK